MLKGCQPTSGTRTLSTSSSGRLLKGSNLARAPQMQPIMQAGHLIVACQRVGLLLPLSLGTDILEPCNRSDALGAISSDSEQDEYEVEVTQEKPHTPISTACSMPPSKLDNYQHDYNERKFLFLPAVMTTLGRISGNFLRLLYVLCHRQAANYFTRMGNPDPSTKAYKQRRGTYFYCNRSPAPRPP